MQFSATLCSEGRAWKRDIPEGWGKFFRNSCEPVIGQARKLWGRGSRKVVSYVNFHGRIPTFLIPEFSPGGHECDVFPEDEGVGIRSVFSGLQDAAPSHSYILCMGSETTLVPHWPFPSLQASFLLSLPTVAENLHRLPICEDQTLFSRFLSLSRESCKVSLWVIKIANSEFLFQNRT